MKNLDLFLYVLVTFASLSVYAYIGAYFAQYGWNREELKKLPQKKADEKRKKMRSRAVDIGMIVFVSLTIFFVTGQQISQDVQRDEQRRGVK